MSDIDKPKKPEDPGPESVPDKPMSAMTPEELAAAAARNQAQWEASKAARDASAAANAPHVAQLRDQLGIKNPDQLREEIILKALHDGGVRLNTSVPKNVSPEGNAGFTDLTLRVGDNFGETEAKVLMEGQLQEVGKSGGMDLDDALNSKGVAEIVDIRRNVRRVYENVLVPGKKGLLGFGSTPDRTERTPTTRFEQPKHSEVVSGGKEEPAVTFTYYASSRRMSGENYEQMVWKDYSNRPGNLLLCEITLPESVASEVQRQIDNDPGFMRTLVERFAKEKLLKDLNAWEAKQGNEALGDARDSLRPPYERWDAHTGGKIYVQKEGGPQGWRQENVRNVKKG